MGKVHKNYGYGVTICGRKTLATLESGKGISYNFTNEPHKVTCLNCLRSMGKEKGEKNADSLLP